MVEEGPVQRYHNGLYDLSQILCHHYSIMSASLPELQAKKKYLGALVTSLQVDVDHERKTLTLSKISAAEYWQRRLPKAVRRSKREMNEAQMALEGKTATYEKYMIELDIAGLQQEEKSPPPIPPHCWSGYEEIMRKEKPCGCGIKWCGEHGDMGLLSSNESPYTCPMCELEYSHQLIEKLSTKLNEETSNLRDVRKEESQLLLLIAEAHLIHATNVVIERKRKLADLNALHIL
jgi:hypothetical protein